MPWKLDGPRKERSRLVRIHWDAGGTACEWRFLRATVSESRRWVTIRAVAQHRDREPGEVCTAVTAEGEATARLARPLGKRRLRHAKVTITRE